MGNLSITKKAKYGSSPHSSSDINFERTNAAAESLSNSDRAILRSVALSRGPVLPERAATHSASASLNAAYHQLRDRAFSYHDAGFPAAILLPSTKDEVVRIVKTVSVLRKPLAVCGGGHSATCLPDDAIVIDMQLLKTILFDASVSIITFQAGCKLKEIDAALLGTGKAFVSGINPDAGACGVTMAGGVGFLSQLYGLGCDSLISAQIVLPNGEVVTTSDASEPALMRALRGGGGNFGVVLEMTCELHELPRCIVGGRISHLVPQASGAKQLLQTFDVFNSKITDKYFIATTLICGRPIVLHSGVAFGNQPRNPGLTRTMTLPLTELAKLPGAWAHLGKSSFKEMVYHTEIQKMLEPLQPRGHNITSGLCISQLSEAIIDLLLHFTRADYPNRLCGVMLLPLGHAVAQGVQGRPTSVAHRGERYWMLVLGRYRATNSKTDEERVKSWVHRLMRKATEIQAGSLASHPWRDAPRRPGREDLSDVDGSGIKAFLKSAKSTYDPDNIMRFNVNIPVNPDDASSDIQSTLQAE